MVVGDFAIELDTVVIGSGPGGYVAAIRAAQKGQKVTIIEKGDIGGICLNVGCIPSKALISAGHRYQEALNGSLFGISTENVTIDFAKTQDWKTNGVVKKLTSGVEMLLKKNKVEILRGEAFFTDEHNFRLMTQETSQSYSFKNMIIATGSRPTDIPGFKYGGRIIDSTGVLNLTEIPKRLIVIGGGYIGCELAGAYANFGTEIIILQRSERILRSFDNDMAKLVIENLEKNNAKIINFAKDMSATQTDKEATVRYTLDGVEQTVSADYVLVSVGRVPNTDKLGLESTGVKTSDNGQIIVDEQGRTNVPHIFAIGDIVPGLPLAHKASYEAKIAAEVIAGQDVKIDYAVIPAVCFTDPELATAGFTPKQATEKGYDAKVSTFPFLANGRALSLGKTEGFVRLVTDKETGSILGAQIAGVGASDLIGELVIAMEAGMTAEDVALSIHAHPTLSETIMDASELELGVPIHI